MFKYIATIAIVSFATVSGASEVSMQEFDTYGVTVSHHASR